MGTEIGISSLSGVRSLLWLPLNRLTTAQCELGGRTESQVGPGAASPQPAEEMLPSLVGGHRAASGVASGERKNTKLA